METKKLPVSNFQWLSKKEISQMSAQSILKIEPQAKIGYAFEVDLHYPDHLHKVCKFYIICKHFV